MTDLRRSDHRTATLAYSRRRHEQRLGFDGNGHAVSDEALARAWRDLQLAWLAEYPAYRARLRERVSAAARRAEILSTKIDRSHADVDYLGRSIEGCG